MDEETKALLKALAESLKETQAAIKLIASGTKDVRVQSGVQRHLTPAGSRLAEVERRLGRPGGRFDAEPASEAVRIDPRQMTEGLDREDPWR